METGTFGTSIFLFIAGILFLIDHYVIKSIGNEMVMFISVILSGVVYAFYFYNKRADLF